MWYAIRGRTEPRIGFLLAVLLPALAHAGCDPTTDLDKSDVANARASVAAHCDCGALGHGAYVSRAAQQANLVLVNKSCVGAVKRCASKSTCGRPGFVTCCRTTSTGRTSCAIKSGTTKCTAHRGRQACVGAVPSCCDACSQGGCVTTTTSTVTTSTATEPTTTTTMPACLPDGSPDFFCVDGSGCCSNLCEKAVCCAGACSDTSFCASCIDEFDPPTSSSFSGCYEGGRRTDADCCTAGDVCVRACGVGYCEPSACLASGGHCCADTVCCNGACPALAMCP